ncbi:response regulator [Palleronia sp. LCG004]|uniref:response regulator n=1 Tax=Palleronia sp. LCG004 TaxID=3079304 RepID=UPI0029422E88|nr:response regulator [Palleronia sp. LCG004]WOI57926.1 response regulator [Palleronia sp. LCG004]
MRLSDIGSRLKRLLTGSGSSRQTVAMGAYLNAIASDALYDLLKSQGYTALALEPAEDQATPGRPLTCVIVEDSAFDRMHLRRLLRSANSGMTILEFETIATARAYLATGPADIVLLDHLLPDGVGMDLAHELIKDIRLRGAGIAMITGAPVDSADGEVPVLAKADLSAASLSGVVAKARTGRSQGGGEAGSLSLPEEAVEILERLIVNLDAGRQALEQGDHEVAHNRYRKSVEDVLALKKHVPTVPDA